MKIKYTSIEQAYKSHIKKARVACKNLTGWERAESIRDYFLTTIHPHVEYTFNQLAMNRVSDRQFAIDLMNELADLTAKNTTGYKLDGVDGRWHFEKLVGDIHFNFHSVNRYSLNGANSKQLITVEHESKVLGYQVFLNLHEYEEWEDSIMENCHSSGAVLVRKIMDRLA